MTAAETITNRKTVACSRDSKDIARFRQLLGSGGMNAETIALFREIILSYYRKNGRDLPWRRTTDPYHILVSEIMLQQTQVGRVVKKYPEFIGAFPDCRTLAHAPLNEVLAVWQGMGYNRRAIRLQVCARTILSECGGRLPDDVAFLESLPGIGKATARSILVFAFNRPGVFIETNIRRVFIHFFFEGRRGIADREILPLVKKTLDSKNPLIWYSALMDYGTMLKTGDANPNRRSAHYTRQPDFIGSDRQIRGILLKHLIANQNLTEEELLQGTGDFKPERVRRIIGCLVAEGFCERAGFRIRLCDQ